MSNLDNLEGRGEASRVFKYIKACGERQKLKEGSFGELEGLLTSYVIYATSSQQIGMEASGLYINVKLELGSVLRKYFKSWTEGVCIDITT